jgi:hypothetical protein
MSALVLVPPAQRAHALTRYRMWLLSWEMGKLQAAFTATLAPVLLDFARAMTKAVGHLDRFIRTTKGLGNDS